MLTDRMDVGGAETHIYELIRGLRRMGAEVELLSGGGRLADRLRDDGVRCFCTDLFCRNPLSILRARWMLRRLVRERGYDILHAHARIPALLLRGCRRWGCRSVVTVHARFGSNRLLSRLCFWGDETVAVSEDLRRYVCERYGVPAERVSVIANGVDCRRFRADAVGGKRDGTRLLFASRMDADCSLGAALLCEIAPALCRSYPSLQITLAGGGSCFAEMSEAANRVNHLLGRVAVRAVGGVEDVAVLLREQDIFVGVSRAAMEAAASGCAVVLCGNEGYGGILDAESTVAASLSNFCCRNQGRPCAELLERDLRLLLEHDGLRRACAEEGRSVIQSGFDVDTMCKKTLALYRSVLPYRQDAVLTVGGYFGCGNIGDDAILLGFLEAVRELAPRVSVQALTRSPRRDRRRFGVSCIKRNDPIAVRLAFLGSRAFLCGGGSLLQNATSNRSLCYYLGLMRIARRCGCHSVLFSGGIGPLLGGRAAARVRRELSVCRYISLRDADSMRYLRRLGISADRLHEGADPALLMPPPPKGRGEAILSEHGVWHHVGSILCVVLRGGAFCAIRRDITVAAIRVVCQKRRLVPLLPILDEREDEEATRLAAEALGGCVIHLREVSDLTALLSTAEAAVTMRLHGMILASSVALPTLGVSPDPRDKKLSSFAREVGQECLDAERLTVGEMVEAIGLCLDSRASRAPILRDAVQEMQKKSRKDIANILEMIYNMAK